MDCRVSEESYRFTVAGRVQGVFFRQSTADLARRLGLAGWVRNLPDGRVEGLACGAVAALQQLRDWLQYGTPAARVDAVEWVSCDEIVTGGFEIRR